MNWHPSYNTATNIPQVCLDHFDELMKDIKEPKVHLSQANIHFPSTNKIEMEKGYEHKRIILNPRHGHHNFQKEELEALRDILANFECLICKNIPIEPYECSVCEVIFCFECITDHTKLTSGQNARRCPQCKQ